MSMSMSMSVSSLSSILEELWMVGNAGGFADRVLDLVCVFNLGGGVGVDDDDDDGSDDDGSDNVCDERSPFASES